MNLKPLSKSPVSNVNSISSLLNAVPIVPKSTLINKSHNLYVLHKNTTVNPSTQSLNPNDLLALAKCQNGFDFYNIFCLKSKSGSSLNGKKSSSTFKTAGKYRKFMCHYRNNNSNERLIEFLRKGFIQGTIPYPVGAYYCEKVSNPNQQNGPSPKTSKDDACQIKKDEIKQRNLDIYRIKTNIDGLGKSRIKKDEPSKSDKELQQQNTQQIPDLPILNESPSKYAKDYQFPIIDPCGSLNDRPFDPRGEMLSKPIDICNQEYKLGYSKQEHFKAVPYDTCSPGKKDIGRRTAKCSHEKRPSTSAAPRGQLSNDPGKGEIKSLKLASSVQDSSSPSNNGGDGSMKMGGDGSSRGNAAGKNTKCKKLEFQCPPKKRKRGSPKPNICHDVCKAIEAINEMQKDPCKNQLKGNKTPCKMVDGKVVCKIKNMCCVLEKYDPCNSSHKNIQEPKPGDKQFFCKIGDVFCVCTKMDKKNGEYVASSSEPKSSCKPQKWSTIVCEPSKGQADSDTAAQEDFVKRMDGLCDAVKGKPEKAEAISVNHTPPTVSESSKVDEKVLKKVESKERIRTAAEQMQMFCMGSLQKLKDCLPKSMSASKSIEKTKSSADSKIRTNDISDAPPKVVESLKPKAKVTSNAELPNICEPQTKKIDLCDPSPKATEISMPTNIPRVLANVEESNICERKSENKKSLDNSVSEESPKIELCEFKDPCKLVETSKLSVPELSKNASNICIPQEPCEPAQKSMAPIVDPCKSELAPKIVPKQDIPDDENSKDEKRNRPCMPENKPPCTICGNKIVCEFKDKTCVCEIYNPCNPEHRDPPKLSPGDNKSICRIGDLHCECTKRCDIFTKLKDSCKEPKDSCKTPSPISTDMSNGNKEPVQIKKCKIIQGKLVYELKNTCCVCEKFDPCNPEHTNIAKSRSTDRIACCVIENMYCQCVKKSDVKIPKAQRDVNASCTGNDDKDALFKAIFDTVKLERDARVARRGISKYPVISKMNCSQESAGKLSTDSFAEICKRANASCSSGTKPQTSTPIENTNCDFDKKDKPIQSSPVDCGKVDWAIPLDKKKNQSCEKLSKAICESIEMASKTKSALKNDCEGTIDTVKNTAKHCEEISKSASPEPKWNDTLCESTGNDSCISIQGTKERSRTTEPCIEVDPCKTKMELPTNDPCKKISEVSSTETDPCTLKIDPGSKISSNLKLDNKCTPPQNGKIKIDPCKRNSSDSGKSKKDPCKPKSDPCSTKSDPCKSTIQGDSKATFDSSDKSGSVKDPCAPKDDPSKLQQDPSKLKASSSVSKKEPSKEYPCGPKQSSKPKIDPCSSKEDLCSPKKDDPCKPKADPSAPKKDPCKPKIDPCKPKANPSPEKKDPCKPKTDPCKPKVDPCAPKKDPCKPKADPCKPKADSSPAKKDPCKPKTDPCKPKVDPCAPKKDPCKPNADPCKPKVDPCAPKKDPCKPKTDPCKPKPDPCAPKKDPFKPKTDPCKPKVDPCAPKKDPSKPKIDPCKPKSDPCAPKKDPCKPKMDPCIPKADPGAPKKDPCKPKADPCKPKEDPCAPKKDPSKPKIDPCKPESDPCVPKKDPCKPKMDPCKPKADPCIPKKDPCKPKVDPCKPKSDPCAPKKDPCKPKQNLCASREDPCKAKSDPCLSKRDPCAPCIPKIDLCAPKKNPCKAKTDPCAIKKDLCKVKSDPCLSKRDTCAPCMPKIDPCAPKKDPCKPKADPCASKKDPCKPKIDPCASKEDSCEPKENPCASEKDPSKVVKSAKSKSLEVQPCSNEPRVALVNLIKPKVPYKSTDNIYAKATPKPDPCKTDLDKLRDICKPKTDPCEKPSPIKSDPCLPQGDPCDKDIWVYPPLEPEPEKPTHGVCKPKEDNMKYAPKDPCKPKTKPCEPPYIDPNRINESLCTPPKPKINYELPCKDVKREVPPNKCNDQPRVAISDIVKKADPCKPVIDQSPSKTSMCVPLPKAYKAMIEECKPPEPPAKVCKHPIEEFKRESPDPRASVEACTQAKAKMKTEDCDLPCCTKILPKVLADPCKTCDPLAMIATRLGLKAKVIKKYSSEVIPCKLHKQPGNSEQQMTKEPCVEIKQKPPTCVFGSDKEKAPKPCIELKDQPCFPSNVDPCKPRPPPCPIVCKYKKDPREFATFPSTTQSDSCDQIIKPNVRTRDEIKEGTKIALHKKEPKEDLDSDMSKFSARNDEAPFNIQEELMKKQEYCTDADPCTIEKVEKPKPCKKINEPIQKHDQSKYDPCNEKIACNIKEAITETQCSTSIIKLKDCKAKPKKEDPRKPTGLNIKASDTIKPKIDKCTSSIPPDTLQYPCPPPASPNLDKGSSKSILSILTRAKQPAPYDPNSPCKINTEINDPKLNNIEMIDPKGNMHAPVMENTHTTRIEEPYLNQAAVEDPRQHIAQCTSSRVNKLKTKLTSSSDKLCKNKDPSEKEKNEKLKLSEELCKKLKGDEKACSDPNQREDGSCKYIKRKPCADQEGGCPQHGTGKGSCYEDSCKNIDGVHSRPHCRPAPKHNQLPFKPDGCSKESLPTADILIFPTPTHQEIPDCTPRREVHPAPGMKPPFMNPPRTKTTCKEDPLKPMEKETSVSDCTIPHELCSKGDSKPVEINCNIFPHCSAIYDASKHQQWCAAPVNGEPQVASGRICADYVKRKNRIEGTTSTVLPNLEEVPNSPRFDVALPVPNNDDKGIVAGTKGLLQSLCSAICPRKKGDGKSQATGRCHKDINCEGIPPKAGCTLLPECGSKEDKEALKAKNLKQWPFLEQPIKSGPNVLRGCRTRNDKQTYMAQKRKCQPKSEGEEKPTSEGEANKSTCPPKPDPMPKDNPVKSRNIVDPNSKWRKC